MKKINPYLFLTILTLSAFFVVSGLNLIKSYTIADCVLLFVIFLISFGYVGETMSDSKSIVLKRIAKAYYLFMIGGATYLFMEVTFRGYSHISMFVVGGLCFILIGLINELTTLSITTQMLLSAGIITMLEYISGCILNLGLGLNVWDYSNMPYNLNGQICLIFSVLWIFVSLFAIAVDDIIRHIVFGESFPKYYL